jgi:hypothetical protein
MLLTAALCQVVAATRPVAAQFVTHVAAIVGQIANLRPLDTFLVGALELRVQFAGLNSRGTQGHVVLV